MGFELSPVAGDLTVSKLAGLKKPEHKLGMAW